MEEQSSDRINKPGTSIPCTGEISIGETTEMRKAPTLSLRGAEHEEYGETLKGEGCASLYRYYVVRTFEDTYSINRHFTDRL